MPGVQRVTGGVAGVKNVGWYWIGGAGEPHMASLSRVVKGALDCWVSAQHSIAQRSTAQELALAPQNRAAPLPQQGALPCTGLGMPSTTPPATCPTCVGPLLESLHDGLQPATDHKPAGTQEQKAPTHSVAASAAWQLDAQSQPANIAHKLPFACHCHLTALAAQQACTLVPRHAPPGSPSAPPLCKPTATHMSLFTSTTNSPVAAWMP